MTTENLAKRGSKSKPCVACASKIPASAIKCVKCGSYQNYRRYFEFGNTTIALLIALISVVSLAHKNISDLYRSLFVDPFEPIVVASVSSIERKKVSILFQNNQNWPPTRTLNLSILSPRKSPLCISSFTRHSRRSSFRSGQIAYEDIPTTSNTS